MRGEIEFELAGDRWTMMRGDFANLPPGPPHAWTMKSNGAQLALFSMNHRVGAAFVGMGERQDGAQVALRLVDGLPHTFFNRSDLDETAGPFRMDVREHPRGGTEVQRIERAGVFAVAREFFRHHLQ